MNKLETLFKETYKVNPEFEYSAPSRINLIGEHIDYNGGMVLPAAISRYIKALVSKRNDNKICFKSTAFEGVLERNLDDLKYDAKYDWANYGFGIFQTLQDDGYKFKFGLNILITSNIPLGSGLSSSAAFLDLICFIASDIYNLNLTKDDIVKESVKTENVYCGLKCGIMDEAAIALGEENKCLYLNCNNFTYKKINLDLGNYKFVVLQTNKPRKLTESKYNERVDECNKALNILKNHYPSINNLCDLKPEMLNDIEKYLNDQILFKRVRHCITENDRVYQFVEALKIKDLNKISSLLKSSHDSLKNDYEVTGLHLDTITEEAIKAGAIASRMTGAGFGGCAIALVDEKIFDDFANKTSKAYEQKTGITPAIYMVDIVSGPKFERKL